MAKEPKTKDVVLSEAPQVEERLYTCVVCPTSCQIHVCFDAQGNPVRIYGHTCKRGETYALAEATNPVRTVTATIPVVGTLEPLSVKTSVAVSKALIPEVLEALKPLGKKVVRPVHVGDVLLAGVCGTEADVVATKNLF